MTRDEVYLRHILDAIERIESYAGRGKEAFLSDTLVRDQEPGSPGRRWQACGTC